MIWEILTRDLPWAHVATTWAIRDKVESGERPPIPGNAPPALSGIAESCWVADAAARPTFEAVLRDLGETA